MSTLLLAGLRATEPIGFLAAVGLLRVIDGRGMFGRVRLGWSDAPGWPAELLTERDCGDADLVADLLAHMGGRANFPAFSGWTPAGELVGAADKPADEPAEGDDVEVEKGRWKDVKVGPTLFRDWLVRTRPAATPADRESSDFLAAFGSELVTATSSGELKPTALHMTSGNQSFLKIVREIAASLDPAARPHPEASGSAADAFLEAVFDRPDGWRGADRLTSMRFDSDREAIYALSAAAPGPAGPRSNRAAVWLAVESLPVFPCAPSPGRALRLHTRGFDRDLSVFRWPVWLGHWSVRAVRTALGLRSVHDGRPGQELRSLGVWAVMESARSTSAKGYGQLRPATRLRWPTHP